MRKVLFVVSATAAALAFVTGATATQPAQEHPPPPPPKEEPHPPPPPPEPESHPKKATTSAARGIAARSITNRHLATGAVNSRVLQTRIWNMIRRGVRTVVGPRGLVGPQGAQGAQGQAGAAGSTGAKGDKGDQGLAGATGPTGPTGPQGPQGATGPQGLQGPAGASALNPVPAGQTIRGAVGGDFDAAAAAGDWGVVVTFPMPAGNNLGDNEIFVNVAGWQSGDAGQEQPETTDTNDDCEGTPAAPTAPAGVVCIYVAGGDNAVDVNGWSILPGTGESPYGFKLGWTNASAGDTFVDAVWAYKAP